MRSTAFSMHPLRVLAGEDRALAAALDAAGIAGVPVEDCRRRLVAGQHDLLGVDDDDVVAAIHVRREAGLVLAAQPHRDQRREPPDARARRRRSAATSCRCRPVWRKRSSCHAARKCRRSTGWVPRLGKSELQNQYRTIKTRQLGVWYYSTRHLRDGLAKCTL